MRSKYIVPALPATIGELSESFEGITLTRPVGPKVLSPSSTGGGHDWPVSPATIHHQGAIIWGRLPVGSFYDLDLPVILIAEGTHPVLVFEYAYARYPGVYEDSLQVMISGDCGITWQKLFDKGGVDLQTAPVHGPLILSPVIGRMGK